MNIRPSGANVVLEPLNAEEKAEVLKWAGQGLSEAEQGLALAVHTDKTGIARIKAVGPGNVAEACLEQPHLKPGWIVLYRKRAAHFTHTIEGRDVTILTSNQLLCAIDIELAPSWAAIIPLGWYGLIEDRNEAYESACEGKGHIIRPRGATTSFVTPELVLHGGRLLEHGKGVHMPVPKDRSRVVLEPVRGWKQSHVASKGEDIAFSAQTATWVRFRGRDYYFGAADPNEPGCAPYAWSD